MPEAVVAELVAQRPDLDTGPWLAPVSLSPCARSRLITGGVEALDSVLDPARFRALALSPGATLLNATADLAQVVAVQDERPLYAGPAGQHAARPTADWQRAEPRAGSATFLGTDRLLLTAPNSETREHAGRRYEQRTSHRVMLLDSATGAALDEVT